MGSFFISAHGTLRKDGQRQTMRKFIVPANVTIYFFNPAYTAMYASFSDMIMDMLIGPSYTYDTELSIRGLAIEVFKEGDLCLDYSTHTDGAKFRDPCGLYRVGNFTEMKPTIPLPFGTSKMLKEWVTGVGGGITNTAMGNHFYWGACREHDLDNRAVSRRHFEGFSQSAVGAKILVPGQTQPTSASSKDEKARNSRIDHLNGSQPHHAALHKTAVQRLLANIKKTGGLYAG
jgi:hypothetical protein